MAGAGTATAVMRECLEGWYAPTMPTSHRAWIVMLALFLGSCGPEQPEPQTPRFRVISYNILVGFADHRVGDPYLPGAERKRNITEFLVEEQPDVVAFQEMNGYDPARLQTEAAAWGHEHVELLKAGGYPTAVTSRYPIVVMERRLEGLHHGLLRVRTGGIDFVVVHLWPFKDAARLNEVGAALAMYENARAEGRPCLMLGDFNAVSARDVPTYDVAARERYAKWKWEIREDGLPRTDVIDACLTAGLVDVCERQGALPEKMPVARIDFILASPDLAERSTGARWLAAPDLLKNSDHPAVVAEFDWESP